MLPFNTEPVASLSDELDRWRDRLDYRGPVTLDEVRRILAGDVTVEVRSEDRELVEGYRGAMSFVLRRADDPSFGWNRELLIGLQDRVLAGKWSQGAGRFRTGTRLVVNNLTGAVAFTPPPSDEVPRLADEMCGQAQAMSDHEHP